MKAISEVQRLLAARIDKTWADSVLAEAQGHVDPRWPWTVSLTNLKGDALNERWNDAWRWIVAWNAWAADNRCPLSNANRRVGSAIRAIPTHVTFADLDTAAAATESDWPDRLTKVRSRAGYLHEIFPNTLTSALLRSACALGEVDLELAVAAATWFCEHDANGLTARQVPIAGVHAKWLDCNSRLVTGLAGRPELGLVTRPSRVQFSYLDNRWLQHGNRRRDSVSLDEPDQPPEYQPDVVLVAENKDTALFFPPVEGGIVIEGNGNAVTRLAKIPWIRACPTIVYWGDIDAHGLGILDLFRSTGIPAEAILMDEATLHRYAAYASPTYADGSQLPRGVPPPTPFLTSHERQLLERITDPAWTGPRRIEQERIPLDVAHEALIQVLSRRRAQSSPRSSA